MYKVLIADDETFIRNLLEKNLRASGLPIEITISAENGQEALEKAVISPPDIVITDIAMPIKNGLELIRSLQEHNISSKNIIISGYDEFDYVKTAIALGVTDYLLKPFMPEELISVFEKIIHDLDCQNSFHQNLSMLMKQADKNRFLNRSNILQSLLDGASLSQEEILQLEFPPETADTCYLTCLLSLMGTIWDFRLQEQLESFSKLIQTGYFSEELSFYAVSLEPSKLVLCFCSSMRDERCFLESIFKGVEKLSNSLIQYYDIVAYGSLGRVYHTLSGLRSSYEDALLTWKEALHPEKRIRIFGERQQEEAVEPGDISGQIKNTKSCIRGAVMNGNVSEASVLLQQLMNLYASISDKGSEYILISAGELLQNTSMKITDVAESCGYDNQRYFASSFKKYYGCTPTDFKLIVTKEHLF